MEHRQNLKSGLLTNTVNNKSPPSNGQLVDKYDRTNTFTDPNEFRRNTTFARTFTYDGAAQALQPPVQGLVRRLSEIGQVIDPDAQFTKAVIKEYTTIAREGNDGDIPRPEGFAYKYYFWKVIFFIILLSITMGIIAAGFMNFIDNVPKQWRQCNYKNDISCGDQYSGHVYFLFITTGAGICVGLIRWATVYPDNLPGLFADVLQYHVDPKWVWITLTISAISIGGGATLGPEQGLGNMGGGLATLLGEYIDFGEEDYHRLFNLAGIGSALGALFPSPLLGSLMMHELGEPPKTFMESTIILSVSAVVCFSIYFEMIGVTFLNEIPMSQYQLTEKWTEDGYQSWQLGTGIIFGIISAPICFLCLLSIGISKQFFYRIRRALRKKPFLRELVPATLGGFICGCIFYCLPSTIGNGSMELSYYVYYGRNGEIPMNLLLMDGFARCFLMGICMNCGFIGGIVFPFLTIGIIVAVYVYYYYNYIPLAMCISCFMVSIPCGICPLPYTFAGLAIFTFFLGTYQTAPVFTACFISYWIISGSGMLAVFGARGDAMRAAEQEADRLEDERELAEKMGKVLDVETKTSHFFESDVDKTTQRKEAAALALKTYLDATARTTTK